MNFQHMWWRLVGYPEFPPKTVKTRRLSLNDPRREWMYFYYKHNLLNVSEIADHYKVTRERVRQCLWKVYRENT